jgi:hypothetical protein
LIEDTPLAYPSFASASYFKNYSMAKVQLKAAAIVLLFWPFSTPFNPHLLFVTDSVPTQVTVAA